MLVADPARQVDYSLWINSLEGDFIVCGIGVV